MKKVIRLTEDDLTRLVKRIIKEQGQEKNFSKCAKNYVKYLFTPSVMGLDQQGEEIVTDGGELFFWNNNKIPTINNREAYDRFIEYLKEAIESQYVDPDDDCGDLTFEDVEPFIRELYLDAINQARGDKMSIDLVRKKPSKINNMFDNVMDDPENNPSNFSDEFEYADNIISYVFDKLFNNADISEKDEEKIKDFFKEEYGDAIFERYRSEVGDNEFEY
jgi:hypothetical protein